MDIPADNPNTLFEEFKEKIVHVDFTQSVIKSVSETALNDFAEKLLEKSPWANKTKEEKREYTDTINSLFGNGTHENLITLLKIGDPASHTFYLDRLSDLLARMTNYAMLLRDLIQAHLAEKTGKS